MSNIIAEAKYRMVIMLNVTLPEASKYVTSRRFVNCAQPKCGSKNIRLNISGEDNTNEENHILDSMHCYRLPLMLLLLLEVRNNHR